MRKKAAVAFVFLLMVSTVFGQESWEGNAAIVRTGEFSTPGLYAASNSFPKNTRILVENAQSGKSVQVTVIQRIEGPGNIFLLLSEQAGRQIGLSGSDVVRAHTRVLSSPDVDLSESLREQPYTTDPDLNPSLSVGPELLAAEDGTGTVAAAVPKPIPVAEEQVEEIVLAEQPGDEAAPQPEAAVEEKAQPSDMAAAEDGTETAAEDGTEAVAPAKTPEEQRLEELADRLPQKQLYLPPRQQPIFALAEEEVEVAEDGTATAAEEAPEEARVTEVTEVEEAPVVAEEAAEEGPRVSMLVPPEDETQLEVELPGPETVEPEKPSPEGTRLEAPAEEALLAMEPEVPTYETPEVAAKEPEAVEIAMVETPPPPVGETVALSDSLPARTYFLQLGAYSTHGLAEKLARDLSTTYSVTILPVTSGGRLFYKVLVGPLNVDESGTLLYQFRARGFKDAFIQYVE